MKVIDAECAKSQILAILYPEGVPPQRQGEYQAVSRAIAGILGVVSCPEQRGGWQDLALDALLSLPASGESTRHSDGDAPCEAPGCKALPPPGARRCVAHFWANIGDPCLVATCNDTGSGTDPLCRWCMMSFFDSPYTSRVEWLSTRTDRLKRPTIDADTRSHLTPSPGEEEGLQADLGAAEGECPCPEQQPGDPVPLDLLSAGKCEIAHCPNASILGGKYCLRCVENAIHSYGKIKLRCYNKLCHNEGNNIYCNDCYYELLSNWTYNSHLKIFKIWPVRRVYMVRDSILPELPPGARCQESECQKEKMMGGKRCQDHLFDTIGKCIVWYCTSNREKNLNSSLCTNHKYIYIDSKIGSIEEWLFSLIR